MTCIMHDFQAAGYSSVLECDVLTVLDHVNCTSEAGAGGIQAKVATCNFPSTTGKTTETHPLKLKFQLLKMGSFIVYRVMSNQHHHTHCEHGKSTPSLLLN